MSHTTKAWVLGISLFVFSVLFFGGFGYFSSATVILIISIILCALIMTQCVGSLTPQGDFEIKSHHVYSILSLLYIIAVIWLGNYIRYAVLPID